mmetsp:Transcript_24780/g.83575  ORF Transcript_24780/g.83575 Transcript_24780/m.83575 type:complete len:230 (+) Transcript_24780:61-750(+)
MSHVVMRGSGCARQHAHSMMRALEIGPIRPRQNLDSPAAHDAAITRRVYKPPRERSSACVPFSTTRPSLSTAMLSALRMVDSRCAMTSVVRRVSATTASSASCTTRSLSLSSADVASSSSSTAGLRTMARAIATRCFWPPESFEPPWPTCVAYPSARLLVMKPCALARRAAPSTSASLAPALPYRMLSATEPWKRTGSCPTSPSCARSQRTFRSRRSTPSSRIAPPCGS